MSHQDELEARAAALRAWAGKVTDAAMQELDALRVAVEVRCEAVSAALADTSALDTALHEVLAQFSQAARQQADDAARIARTQAVAEAEVRLDFQRADFERMLAETRAEAEAQRAAGLAREAELDGALTAARVQADAIRADAAAQLEAARSTQARLLQESQAKLDAARREAEHALAAQRGAVDDVRGQLEAMHAQFDAVRVQFEETRVQLSESQRARTDAIQAVDAARTAAQEQVERAREAAQMQARTQIEAVRRSTAEELAAAQTAHARARADLEAAHARALAGVEAERHAARTERDAARTERDGALRERDAALAERDAAQTERKRAEATRDATHAERETASTAAQALQAEIDRLRAQMTAARTEAAAAQADAGSARAAADAARDDASATRAAVDSLRRERDAAREEIAAAREEARVAQTQARAAREDAQSVRPLVQVLDRLTATIRTLDDATSLTQVLDALLDGVGDMFPRAALFLVKADRLQEWRRVGHASAPLPPAPVNGAAVTPAPGSPLDQAMASGRAILAGRDLADTLTGGTGERDDDDTSAPWTATFPIAMGNRVVAVVQADEGDRAATAANEHDRQMALLATDLLVRHAGQCLAVLTATAAASAQASAERAAPQPAPPGASAAPSSLPPTRTRADVPYAAEDARRYARLLVSEIRRYNEANLGTGTRDTTLYERLRDDIERCRKLYAARVPAEIRTTSNFFDDALLHILAGGDPEAFRRLRARTGVDAAVEDPQRVVVRS